MIDSIKTVLAKGLRHGIRLLSIGKRHRNRVVFFSYFGNQYSCNPYYISEYLREKDPSCEIVWAFCDPAKYACLKEQGIDVVRYNSLAFLRILMTSGVIVTNSEIPSWWAFGKEQTLINTWHGGGAYKKVGSAYQKETEGKQKRGALARTNSYVYLSSSKAFTQWVIRESFEHKGTVLEYGMPRNDSLVNQDRPNLPSRVKKALKIPETRKILLYAPTYRESKSAAEYALDCKRLRETLKERFGGEWVILYRMHYMIINALECSKDYIDASSYPNMQELLYAADVVLTDYSSCMWDFALTGRPCLLYATDLDQYDMERGFYTDIHTWPFPLAEDFDTLLQNICGFDEEMYKKDVEGHFRELGSRETGKATEHVAEFIRQKMYGEPDTE